MATAVTDELDVLMESEVAGVVDEVARQILSGLKVSSAAGQTEAFVATPKDYDQLTDRLSEPAKKDHEKLYEAAAETVTRTSIELDALDPKEANANSSKFRSLKADFQTAANSTYLHELFFANCFDPRSELFQDSLTYMRLARDWGDFDSWMKDFMGSALSAREGWVVCGYSAYLKKFVNVVVDGHSDGILVGLIPTLVIDMFEHAYVRDYGIDKETYLRAVMGEIDWEVVEDRVRRIDSAKEFL